MNVLVCGSRSWILVEPIREQLKMLGNEVTVIHGAAKGADSIAAEIAVELGVNVIACPPDWRRYGRAAGKIGNKQMLQDHQPELLLAFVQNWSNSPGTRHMVVAAQAAGVQTRVFDENGAIDVCTDED